MSIAGDTPPGPAAGGNFPDSRILEGRRFLTILDRYLGLAAFKGFLLVLGVLLVLFSFLELLGQVNDIGKGGYRLADAFLYVALTVPRRAVELMPVSVLLGSITSLGMLADHQELLAMQAGGMSVRRISLAVLAAGLATMVMGLAAAEFIAPPLDQQARIRRSQARYGKEVMLSKNGFWVRQGASFIHVGKTISAREAADIEIFEFTPEGALRRHRHAQSGVIDTGGRWHLYGVVEREFDGAGIRQGRLSRLSLPAPLTAEQVGILQMPPESLSLSDLAVYVAGLRRQGQNADRHALVLWQKLALPLVNGAMVLLSLTFIFGATRLRSAGRRIFVGTVVGILFYLANQICGHLGLILHLPAPLTALAPVAAILWLAAARLRRVS